MSIYMALKDRAPGQPILYFGDHLRQPYGEKDLETVKKYVLEVIDFLIEQGAKSAVIACNTATAAGLEAAVRKFSIPVLGVIEAGAAQAAQATKNKRIGLAATRGTVESGAYEEAIKKINNTLKVFSAPCPKFIFLVEENKMDSREAHEAAMEYLLPLKDEGIDTLILGCTHYPFLKKTIRKVIGEDIFIVDPAEMTAISTTALLKNKNLLGKTRDSLKEDLFFTTGSRDQFKEIIKNLTGMQFPEVRSVKLS